MVGREAAKAQTQSKVRVGKPAAQAERPRLSLVKHVEVDRSRDALLTDFGKTTLEDRYLLQGESYQDMFARVATAYADDSEHAQRVYDYISRLWFMPATPVLSNGGADRGLPISCFLNAVPDSLEGIVSTWNENVFLAANGGGIGTYWGGVRSIGEKVKGAGQTLKRGTLIKSIRLTGDAQEIDCRFDGIKGLRFTHRGGSRAIQRPQA